MSLFVLLFLITIMAFESDTSKLMHLRNRKYSNDTLDGKAKFPLPFLVSIQASTKKGKYAHLCAGTIIDESFVLTAAHCFHEINDPKKLSVTAGSNTLTVSPEHRHHVLKITIHEDFKPLTGPDIALLEVNPPFKIDNKTISKIVVNDTSPVNEMNGYLVGWDKANKGAVELISFTTIKNNKCVDNGFIYVKDTEICGISHKGRGACDGDSGGPLVNEEFKVQIGLLSYGRKPCMKGGIYAFTRTSKFVDWVLENK